MIFDPDVPAEDRERIQKALSDIDEFGDAFHERLARFIQTSDLSIFIGPAKSVGGSGSVRLADQWAARRAVKRGGLTMFDAAGYVRLNIARETIDTGGQRGIEGTLVHEGKHALDFALMLSSFSAGVTQEIFNPRAYQREYSAHLTSAFYLRLRGGEYAEEGIGLGLLRVREGELSIDSEGIKKRLANNYRLTPETPGDTLDACSFPRIRPPGKKWFRFF